MKDIDVYVFGDSITYGAWDREKCGWVTRLRLNLETDSEKSYNNVFNLGISGDTTEGVKKRFYSEIETRKKEQNESIVLFAIGTNDTQDINGKYRVTLEEFENNIISLIEMARKYTTHIGFLGLTKVDETKVVPLPWNKEKSYFNEKIIKFDNKLQEICKKNNIKYLKLYDLLSANDLEDGLHPSTQGHQKLSDKITNFVKEEFIDIF